ncbi:MAG: hypothetical protein H6754_03315 [Candidatus Omnitrophica bacterium]|nr:hypothetical protein [Candidatus Omnitrophota bacterium]
MRFQNKKEEFAATVETVCLILSLGAVFLQIWVLISAIEAYLQGKYANLLPAVILSGIAFAGCGMSALLTRIDFLKGITEGRTKTYQKNL